MSNILNQLNLQLNTQFAKEAKDCIKIYNTLLDNTGHVWESNFIVFVEKCYNKTSKYNIYKPTKIGYIFLKGVE